MTTEDEIELITLVLPTSKQTIPLSRETSVAIWAAVRSGLASTPKEFVTQALERGLAAHRVSTEKPESGIVEEHHPINRDPDSIDEAKYLERKGADKRER